MPAFHDIHQWHRRRGMDRQTIARHGGENIAGFAAIPVDGKQRHKDEWEQEEGKNPDPIYRLINYRKPRLPCGTA